MSRLATDDIARQLQASEARFRRVFEDSPISLQLIARDGRTLRVNRAWLELWGVPERVFEPYVYGTYNVFEDASLKASGTTELVRRAFAGEAFALPPTHYDPAATGRPGRARWIKAYIYPVKSAEKVIDEVVVMHDDVTERFHAERTLGFLAETSSALLATALDYGATLNKVAELGMRQLGGWCAVHVLEAGHLKLAAVAHPEQEKANQLSRLWRDPKPLEELGYGPAHVVRTGEPELRREFVDLVRPKKQVAAEDTLRRIAGAPVNSYLSVPLRERGKVVGALTLLSVDHFYSSEDLSLARELVDRAALALQNARLYDQAQRAIEDHKLLAETMLQGVVRQDSDGTIVFMNPAAERILGRTREQFVGSSPVREELDTIREDGSTFRGMDHPSMVALKTGQPVREVVMGLLNPRDSAYRWLRIDALPLFRPGEARPHEVYTVFADITERKRAEEELRKANLQLAEADRRKNEFLAVLSHELRNPLAPIANSLYILDHAELGGEQADRAKQVIGRQVAQLSHLVNDLLDVTRITRNKIQLQKERLELGEAVRRAVEDNRSLFERAGIRLELSPAPRPILLFADRTRLAQIISNLLQNSAKFTPRGGNTRVSIAIEGNEAVVRVADDGVGMSGETLGRLFQPFSQAEQSIDRSKGGLGLGLALVKGLAELHGGSVSAHSEGLGRGSEMIVRLPFDIGVTRDRAATRTSAGRVRRRVLVIEDNVDAADSLSEALTFDGHEVAVAYNGPDGIAKAREFRPDVVLCDIGLPSMDGYQVARAFRADEALRGTFLVALSGYALPEDLQRAAEAGFERHLAKPPSIETLEQLLEDMPRAAPDGATGTGAPPAAGGPAPEP